MNSPIFTIIISTYNRRDLVPRTIQSVLNQTFTDFELLVIDNGSTDDTCFVVQQFKDRRIQYIPYPNPTASCDAPRNYGICRAKGCLISFLDDDDIWYPERLEIVKNTFDENPDVSAVCHNENRRVNNRIDKVMKYGPCSENIFETLLYERNCLSPSATTIKAGVLRKLRGFNLRSEFESASDYDLWLRMAKRGENIHFIDKPLGEFCLTGDNWSIVNPAFESRVAYLIKEHITNYEKKDIYQISKRGSWRLFQLYCISARSFLKAGNYKNAVKYYYISLMFIIMKPALIGLLYRKIIEKSTGKSICHQQ